MFIFHEQGCNVCKIPSLTAEGLFSGLCSNKQTRKGLSRLMQGYELVLCFASWQSLEVELEARDCTVQEIRQTAASFCRREASGQDAWGNMIPTPLSSGGFPCRRADQHNPQGTKLVSRQEQQPSGAHRVQLENGQQPLSQVSPPSSYQQRLTYTQSRESCLPFAVSEQMHHQFLRKAKFSSTLLAFQAEHLNWKPDVGGTSQSRQLLCDPRGSLSTR